MDDDKYFEHWYNLKLFLNNYRAKYSKNEFGWTLLCCTFD